MNNSEDLKKILQVYNGDDWLLENGVISDLSKNAIVVGTYASYPEVRDLEFTIDEINKKFSMIVYVNFLKLLWITITGRREQILNDLYNDLNTYLHGNYAIRVAILRNAKK